MNMKHYILTLGLGLMLFSSCSSDDVTIDYPIYTDEVGGDYDDCRLEWSEEFDYEGLPDEQVWNYEEGYQRNYEMQDYKKADTKYARVEDGKLIIEAHSDPHDAANGYHFDYSSASVHTKRKVNFKYGRIDIAAKIPVARGMYPIFWMLPVNDEYGAWPNSGEMNIAAYTFGGFYGGQHEKNTVSAWLHTENTANGVASINPGTGSVTSMENAYHLYSMVWKKKRIQFLLDNKVIFTYDKRSNSSAEWPFNKDFYLLLSLAVGGVEGGAFGVDAENFPKRMEVDYVRYYELLQDDETDEVEDPNLIKNGGFELEFEAGTEPTLGSFEKEAVLDHLYQWYARTDNNNQLNIDETEKKTGKRSLKLTTEKVNNPYSIELSYPIEGCDQGEYVFSFWMKTNKVQSPFVASITLAENEADIKKGKDDQKTVWVKTDGIQEITVRNKDYGGHPQQAIYNKTATQEWQKFSVKVKLPQTQLVKFVIRPGAKSENGNQWPSAPADTDLVYWFDDFSFEKVD